MGNLSKSSIEAMIYVIRGQNVMLDSDLAALYGVETKRLNEQVRRNTKRFPSDFMFQLTEDEFRDLRSHFATLNPGRGKHRKYMPMIFSENGVAMLSSVLNSENAIQINIQIMRAFSKLKGLLRSHESLVDRVEKLEKGTAQLFKITFERLDDLEADLTVLPPKRKKIGFS